MGICYIKHIFSIWKYASSSQSQRSLPNAPAQSLIDARTSSHIRETRSYNTEQGKRFEERPRRIPRIQEGPEELQLWKPLSLNTL